MKKIFLTVIFISVLLVSGQVYSQSLKWYDWQDGYEKAIDEKKIMLVDVYTDWCYWCKVMDKETYSKQEVIDLIEADFVPIKINPEKGGTYKFNGKNYSGKELKNKLAKNNFRGYPSTFFVLPKNKKSYPEVGFKKVPEFVTILKKYSKMR